MNEFYTDYAEYMRRFFPDHKVQKISVNTDAGCPNRDGTLGRGGCIYCDNTSFTPAYCFGHKSVAEQIESGKHFFGRKYPDMRYLAYFQSYTGTHRKDVKELEETYLTAAQIPGVVGLIIGTRPDCLPESVTDLLSELNRQLPVFVELGVESMHDSTLRAINRGHDSHCSQNAIISLACKGLHVGVHLIAGLPGESAEDALDTVRQICGLPVESFKLHHLQILRGTPLHRMWTEGLIDVKPLTVDEYLDFCVRVTKNTPRHIAIERFLASSPPEKVIAPSWGLKNYQFTNLLINRLKQDKNISK